MESRTTSGTSWWTFTRNLYEDYYAGHQIRYSEKKKEQGYLFWDRFMNPSILFRQVEGMMRDGMAVNGQAEIPIPSASGENKRARGRLPRMLQPEIRCGFCGPHVCREFFLAPGWSLYYNYKMDRLANALQKERIEER